MFADKLKSISERMRNAGDEIPKEAAEAIAAMGMSLRVLHVGMAAACSGNREATFSVQPWRPEVDRKMVEAAERACQILRDDGMGCRVVERQGKDVDPAAPPEAWQVVVELTW